MKRKIISIITAVICVIVAAILLNKFVFSTSATYIKDVDEKEFQKAVELLSNAYLEGDEVADVYYSDYIKANTKIGQGTAQAKLEDGVSIDKFVKQNAETTDMTEGVKTYDSEMKQVNYEDKATYTVNVEADGLYYIAVDYASVFTALSDFTVSVSVNGNQDYSELKTITLPIQWTDVEKEEFISDTDKKEFPLDSYKDEMAPSQKPIEGWMHTYLYNNTYVSTLPLAVNLKKGTNTIVFENVSSDGLALGALTTEPAEDTSVSYEEYAKSHSDAKLVTEDENALEIDSVYYSKKNTIDAIYGTEVKSSLTRFNIDNEKLNTLMWADAGNEITYTINVKKTGKYNIAFHYKNEKKEFISFETIKIDGEVPFTEMYDYKFPAVSSGYDNLTLADEDGNNYEFYLTEGVHTLSIKQENSPIMEAYRYALLLEQHITNFELEIKKITGSDVDTDRNWKMTKYIADRNGCTIFDEEDVKNGFCTKEEIGKSTIERYLDSYDTIIQHIRFILQDYSDNGNSGAILTYLDEAEVFLDEMEEYPDEIALYTEELTGADNSVLVALSNFTTEVTANAFTLDRIYVYGDESQLGEANDSVFSSLWTGIRSLVNTFTNDKYSTGNNGDDEDTINIWVNRAITHVDLLQKMADTEFAQSEFAKEYKAKTGRDIKVKVSAMPDVNKLTLAIAADQTPDIALGLMSYVPFDLSSRGALYDMTKFDDFWTVANRFPTGSFVSYVYNEAVFAIPETTDFNVIAYRKDIFRNLGLTEPNTWQDLIDELPTLQRYGMNFYHNIALGATGYKWFYQTAPMILQNRGELYVQDENTGLVKTGVDSKNAVRGLQLLGDLFTKYSLPKSVNSFFNSFRYSTYPIGIIGMEDYTLLKNGAPELDGEWGILPYLGTVEEDGTVNRTFVANGTGGVIFGDSSKEPTEKQKMAWEFLKWWTSTEVQKNYTTTLRSSYGKTFYWLSANKEALQQNPMEAADKKVILDQIDWVTDITRTPGQYLLERTISNIWTSMVNDGASGQVAVDEAKNDVNKEIVRKMQELGYYDDDGNMIKKFKLQGYDWIQKNKDEAMPESGEEDK